MSSIQPPDPTRALALDPAKGLPLPSHPVLFPSETNSWLRPSEMEMGQWVMGHGSNGSPFWMGHVGRGSLPVTH